LRVVHPLPWPWRVLLRRPIRLLGRRLRDGEDVVAVAVVCHRRRSGRLAAVEAFSRGSGLGLLALTDRRLVLAGARGWLELPRAAVLGSGTRPGRAGTRLLIVHTMAGELAVDGLSRRDARGWRVALSAPALGRPRPSRPPASLALLAGPLRRRPAKVGPAVLVGAQRSS
jgi:hypothetical protein